MSSMGRAAGAGTKGGSDRREKRPPLLPWSSSTWQRWRSMRRMCTRPIPRTKFVLLKAPASTLYEEKYGGDVGVFTVGMFVERMTSKNVAIGLAVDCTALDLDAFEPLPASASSASAKDGDGTTTDGRIRYFHNPSEWDDYDVDYVRLTQPPPQSQSDAAALALVGVPTPETVRGFIDACSSHFRSRPNTHVALFDSRSGLGAAAFLVASYMVERMRAPLHVALAGLAEVSPPGIFDEGLLRELQLSCRGRRELTVPLDDRPGWYIDPDAYDEEDDDDDDGDEGGDDVEKKRKKGREAVVIPPFSEEKEKAATVMPPPATKRPRVADGASSKNDVPGLQLLAKGSGRYERALTVFRQLTEGLAKASAGGDNGGDGNGGASATSSFPSSGHSLLTREVLESDVLEKRRYSVTWRALGRRGFLLLLADGVYFLEKPDDAEDGDSGNIRISHATGMFFPRPTDTKRTQHRTLLDGVLVMDREGGEGGGKKKTTPRYLAFDLLAHEGGIVCHRPLSTRRRYLTDGVYGARKRVEATDASARSTFARECFRFRVKDYFDARKKTRFVLESFVPKVTHDVDGLVLTPEDAPYGGGDAGKDGGGILVWKKEGCGVTGSEVVERIEGIAG